MSYRAAAWLAWSLGAISVAMFVANVVLYFLAPSLQPTDNWGSVGTVGERSSEVQIQDRV
jgi:hypothetical protein